MARTRWLALGLVGATAVVGVCYLLAGRSAPPREVAPGSESASSPPPVPTTGRIAPESARRIVPGMALADVERVLGPARIEDDTGCLPLYPPGSLIMTRNGPLYGDRHWASGAVAVTVRVNNQTQCVVKVWVRLPDQSRGEAPPR